MFFTYLKSEITKGEFIIILRYKVENKNKMMYQIQMIFQQREIAL